MWFCFMDFIVTPINCLQLRYSKCTVLTNNTIMNVELKRKLASNWNLRVNAHRSENTLISVILIVGMESCSACRQSLYYVIFYLN